MDKEACCVVTEHCTHPWNVEDLLTAPCTCYVCGRRVCKKCSLKLLDAGYSHRVVRACINCVTADPDRFGFEDEENALSYYEKQMEEEL